VSERPGSAEGAPSSLGALTDWARIEPLIDAVLDAPPDRRDVVARELSGGDDAVYARLQSLAAECATDHRLLDRPAAERFSSLFVPDSFPVPETHLTDRLSAALADRYRIERALGAGGMATVYLAQDLKHDRKVALKVLKPELAAVLGAERFVVEIKTTAALQHPHILPLFDSGTADGFLYYVMPFIDGETLRTKLDREKQLSVGEAVKIATEVANALDYAHRHGVVHRDIKPENILLHEGRPLVADFGIAVAVSAAAGGRMTETGLSIGTPHYMSPEQATAAKEITARSDIYSLASVLYEMLAGEPPHSGGWAHQIIMKIVTEEAQPLTQRRKSAPKNVEAAVAQALEKLPADRFETAAKFAEALTDPHFATRTDHPRAVRRSAARTRPAARWLVGLGLVAAGGAIGWVLHRLGTSLPAQVTRFTIPVPGGLDGAGIFPMLSVSPDGRSVVYFQDGTLYRRRLERDAPESLATFPMGCCPQFVEGGRSVLVGNATRFGGELRLVALSGGPIVNAASRPLGEDIVSAGWFRPGVFRRPAGDTAWTLITKPDSGGAVAAYMWPQLLERGQSVLYTRMGPSGMWHDSRIVLEDLTSGVRTTVVSEGTYGRYVPTGHVVYIRDDGTVEAVPFDLRRRRVTGRAFTVAEGVQTGYWGGAGSFAISDAGTFAYVRGSNWQLHQLTWVDRQGKVVGHIGKPITAEGVRLSPDERYAVTYAASPNADIARFDVATGEQRRLTFDPKTEDIPVWSRDGRRVAYRLIMGSNDNRIVMRAADGQGAVEQLYAPHHGGTVLPLDFSPDGSALALEDDGVLILHLASQRVDTVSRSRKRQAQFSPDGRWLAYTTEDTGREEVYVIAYPALTGNQQISTTGGRTPVWSARSGELFFLKGDTVMATSVSTQPRLDWTTPRPLFARPDLSALDYGFGVSADGRRFLYPARNPDAAPREIHVVLNWLEELKARRAP
jgi:eukaryotic-like serine/threonine-protein kinase